MEFMDLLFKKYASPFSMLDGYIQTGRFLEFIIKFIDVQTEDNIWEVWLHKTTDKSFEDFKKQVLGTESNEFNTSKEHVETTVENSRIILDGFIPEE